MLYSLLVDLQGKGIGLLVVLEGKGKFQAEGNKITRRFRRKGIGLLVDNGGKEQNSLIWHTASSSV